MRIYLLLIFLLVAFHCPGQVEIFAGPNSFAQQKVAEVRGGLVHVIAQSGFVEVACNIQGDVIYAQMSSFPQDALYRVADNQVFRGDSRFTSDILFTLEGEHLYQGNSTSPMDIVLTIAPTAVYRGDHIFEPERMFSFNQPLAPIELIAVLWALQAFD